MSHNSFEFEMGEKNESLKSTNEHLITDKIGEERYKFDRPIEYWLLIVGFAIGYGSFWRFPYLIFTCG